MCFLSTQMKQMYFSLDLENLFSASEYSTFFARPLSYCFNFPVS